jgi:hypothetical protein
MLCFTAVTAGFNISFNFRQFKKTRGKDRKIQTVKKLTEQINNGHFDIKAISIAGKMNGQFVHWACSTINQAYSKIGANWITEKQKPKTLIWKGKSFELKHALGISVYSSMLALIGMMFAAYFKNNPQYNRIIFALDSLPIDSANGMELMKAISFTSDSKEMWYQNLQYGIKFQVANLVTYSNDVVSNAPAKSHPVAILADWLAVASLAKLNPEQVKRESNFSDDQIKYFIDLWDSVNSRRKFELLDVDDHKLIKKVKKHNNKLNILKWIKLISTWVKKVWNFILLKLRLKIFSKDNK